jgi:hypothetical protein
MGLKKGRTFGLLKTVGDLNGGKMGSLGLREERGLVGSIPMSLLQWLSQMDNSWNDIYTMILSF